MKAVLRSPAQIKVEYLSALEDVGDRVQAADRAKIDLATVENWRRSDEEFRGALGLAREIHRSRQGRVVSGRVFDVVKEGYPDVQTFRGQIQYEPERDEAGQPIMELMRDEFGDPVVQLDKMGRPHNQCREKLRLDKFGNPIPVTVFRYAEKTTLRVAESLGILEPADKAEGNRPGKDVVFRDRDGGEYTISEIIKERFEATASAKLLPEATTMGKKKKKVKKPKGSNGNPRPSGGY